MSQEDQNDRILDEILAWERGRSRAELYAEMRGDRLMWGWRMWVTYWGSTLAQWWLGERQALAVCLGRLHSGHNVFLHPVMDELEAAVSTNNVYEIVRAELKLTNYRRRLYLLVVMLAPSGLAEGIMGTVIGEFDRQCQAQMGLRAPSVFKMQEARDEDTSASGNAE
jgi:hypothetical protein